jgi:hypothetical protein
MGVRRRGGGQEEMEREKRKEERREEREEKEDKREEKKEDKGEEKKTKGRREGTQEKTFHRLRLKMCVEAKTKCAMGHQAHTLCAVSGLKGI